MEVRHSITPYILGKLWFVVPYFLGNFP
jgi:hypothetical protein